VYAALLTRLGFPEVAARLWEASLDLDAPGPWVGLGRARLTDGELEEAAKAFDRAAQMGFGAAHLHRAEALAASGQFEAAARACDAYLASRPGDLRGLVLKANFLAKGGWIEEAAAVLRSAFEAHPKARELWRGLGLLLLKGGRPDASAEAYHEVVRADPADVDSWVNRGAALLASGRPREAIGAFREALEHDASHALALNDLGVAYYRAGRWKSAAVNLERAAKYLQAPRVLLNLARVREALGDRPRALEAYAQVLRLKPHDAEALSGRKRLAAAGGAKPRRPVRRRASLGARSTKRVRPSKVARKPARPRGSRRTPRSRASSSGRKPSTSRRPRRS